MILKCIVFPFLFTPRKGYAVEGKIAGGLGAQKRESVCEFLSVDLDQWHETGVILPPWDIQSYLETLLFIRTGGCYGHLEGRGQ